jgi:hypothetical protein
MIQADRPLSRAPAAQVQLAPRKLRLENLNKSVCLGRRSGPNAFVQALWCPFRGWLAVQFWHLSAARSRVTAKFTFENW